MAMQSEELSGIVSCLAQVTNVKVVMPSASGHDEVSIDEFLRTLLTVDPMLAAFVMRWLDASRAMREHIERSRPESLLPAEPFRIGISGHVM